MSNQKIDNLFKSKLGHFQVKPPVDAWEAIDGQLSKKQATSFPVYRIAAAVAFAIVSGFIAYNFLKGNEELANQAISSETENKSLAVESTDNKPAENQNSDTGFVKEGNEFVQTSDNPEKRLTYSNLNSLEPLYPVTASNTSAISLTKVEISESPQLALLEEESLPPVTISFRPGNKMLNDDATSEPVKESTLRKAWDYALSVKNGEERPFNIKEMKNELFASNFKKKKSKSQD